MRVIPAIPGADFGGRVEVPSFTSDHTEPLTDDSVNLLDAVRAEGRTRRLVAVLMLMSFAATETTEPVREVA